MKNKGKLPKYKDGIVFVNSDKKGYVVLKRDAKDGKYILTTYTCKDGDLSKGKMKDVKYLEQAEAEKLLRKNRPGWLVIVAVLFVILGCMRLYEGIYVVGVGALVAAAALLAVYCIKPKI